MPERMLGRANGLILAGMTIVTFVRFNWSTSSRPLASRRNRPRPWCGSLPRLKTSLVTKTDLDLALAPIRTDLAVLKWRMGVLLAGVISLVIKAFI